MRGGLLNKAKRGELRRPLPIGYIHDENGQISKDPDAQVQEAIMILFKTFLRVGSAYGVIREYEKQGFLFPHRQHIGFKLGELSWKKITTSTVLNVLKNPIYAGIYTYGKNQVQYSVGGRKTVRVPKEQYHVWLSNSHAAYISEAQYDENNRQLEKNAHPRPDAEHYGAVREGSALLQGIALCGKCGRNMSLRYSKSNLSKQPIYLCDHDNRYYGQSICQYVAGGNIDLALGSLLLETINPLTMDAAISIQREMTVRKEEILRLYDQQLERARHEMNLAKRRYLHVDPDNRLVASELERDWNQKASAFESAKVNYEQKSDIEIREVDDEMKLSLTQLISDFPKIWNDPRTPNREKKRIARHVLEDVTITSDKEKILLGVRFKSGSTKIIEIPRTNRSLKIVNMENEAASKIKELLHLGLTNIEIAQILNEKGLRQGIHSKPFDTYTIYSFIRRYGLPTRTEIAMSNPERWLTANEKMEELGINKSKLYRMRRSGELIYKKCIFRGASYLYKPESGLHNEKARGEDT